MPIANVKYTAGKTTQTRRLRYEPCEDKLLEAQLKTIIGQEHKVDPRTVTIHSVEGAISPKPFGYVERPSATVQSDSAASSEAGQQQQTAVDPPEGTSKSQEPPTGSQAEGTAKSQEPPKGEAKAKAAR